MSCFFTLSNQYTKNKTFNKISSGTPKLNTDNGAKVFGGTLGNT